jgi:hypothetical protein
MIVRYYDYYRRVNGQAAQYLASRRPEYLGIPQRIIGMPFKRGAI